MHLFRQLFRTLCTSLALLLLATSPAWACGACVAPPGPSTVQQKAERVLFVRDPVTKQSLTWVEVRYQGQPQDFGWVVPMPKKPILGVGSQYLFDRLDQAAAPRFSLNYSESRENCTVPVYASSGGGGVGCGSDNSMAQTTSAGSAYSEDTSAGADVSKDHVQVLESASVGPYDYVIIASDKSDDLLTWLNAQGYATPAAALPIIDAHVQKGDVFVALKLKNDAGIDAIRPVSFQMDDADPCVPLRLTSVAAVEDMQVVVYLAGPGRAIPKNHMHIEVNPLKLSWENAGQNYDQLLAAAIDEAAGRAFVTEYSQPMSAVSVDAADGKATVSAVQYSHPLDGVPLPGSMGAAGPSSNAYGTGTLVYAKRLDASAFKDVQTVSDVAKALKASNLPLADEVVTALNAAVTSTGIDWVATQGSGQITQVYYGSVPANGATVASAKLYADLSTFADGTKLAVDQLARQKNLTRLVLRISPKEMDRDPVFAFNDKLPVVKRSYSATVTGVCSQGDDNADTTRLKIAGIDRSYLVTGTPPACSFCGSTFTSASDARFKAMPAASIVELLDENVAAQPVAPDQIALVDTAIAGAQPGTKSLPDGFTLKAADTRVKLPASDPPVHFKSAAAQAAADPGGCGTGRNRWFGAWLGLLAMVGTVVALRRRRA